MRSMTGFVRKTVIGGVLFLLPLGIVVLVFGELYGVAEDAADVIQEVVLPSADSPLVPVLIAVAALVAVAFAAGLFATTNLGQGVFRRAEQLGGASVPGYSIIRQMVADMSGGAALLAGHSEVLVARVEMDGVARFGFVVDRLDCGALAVFMPGAPSVLSGMVVVAQPEQVTETSIRSSDLMTTMQNLGSGLAKLETS